MAMTLGSVSVSDAGVVTKSGVIGRYYDAIVASLTVTLPSGTAAVPFLRQIAARATAEGTAMYNSITQDAKARITSEDGALQRTPNPNDPLTSTLAPGTTKFLGIV